jgi:hypothetical protein
MKILFSILTINMAVYLMSMISDDPNIWLWFHSLFVQVVYCQDGNWYFFENGNDQQLLISAGGLKNIAYRIILHENTNFS